MGEDWRVRALLIVAGLVAGCDSGEPAAESTAHLTGPPAAEKDWTKDDRLLPYVTTCPGRGRFNEDTSDMLPVLVAKLRNSQRDVLRNVREELAAGGEPAMVEIDRMVRRLYADPHSAHTIVNALGVIQMSTETPGPVAQELLRSCLGHPQETVRSGAIRALARHATAPLYDDMLAVLRVSRASTLTNLLTGLYVADRQRTEQLIAGWIAESSHGELMEEAGRLVAGGADAETAALFGPLLERLGDRRVKAFFTATQSHAADAPGDLAYLEGLLEEEDPQARADALMALEYTDRLDLVAGALVNDPDISLRRMACGGLGPHASDPVAHKALVAALYDDDSKTREDSLSALLAIGDAQAADTAVELWRGNQHEIGVATRAIAGHWEANPKLGARVFDVLIEHMAERPAEGLGHKEYLIQAMAQIPGPVSSQFLLDLARSETEPIKGFSAHRFLTLQVSNTGAEGHRLLREAWRLESDPARRFDLLWAGTLGHDEATGQFLAEVLLSERALAHERLWVAERMAREGPAAKVAPLIKRANLRMSHRDFRPAMECLLWRWYG